MNQAKTWVTVTARFFIGLSITLLATGLFTGCECIYKIFKPPVVKIPGQTPPHNQVNLQLKLPPGTVLPDAEIKKRILAAVEPGTLQADQIKVRRCSCDPNLLNITLPSSLTIEGADGEMSVRTKANGAGGGIDLPIDQNSIGANFAISPFDNARAATSAIDDSLARYVRVGNVKPANTISVAVFDSGLDPSYLPPKTWQRFTHQCGSILNTAGWNFTDEDESNTKDETSMHHGSRVANLIARQFNDSQVAVKIVPMRVLNSANAGDLFGVLCAMATAQKNDIKVFNMSFGYYGKEDDLFRKYVASATVAGIRLVVAAGNRTVEAGKIDRNTTSMTPKFYPAYFSQTNDNVFVATTAHLDGNKLLGCDRQNYGSEQVLGVLGDDDCSFRPLPLQGGKLAQIFGSSYATPVLAGQLARALKENPGKIQGWKTLPTTLSSMKQAQGGGQLYQNAYVKSESVQPPQ